MLHSTKGAILNQWGGMAMAFVTTSELIKAPGFRMLMEGIGIELFLVVAFFKQDFCLAACRPNVLGLRP
jgi:hypothetical protein